MYGIVTCPKCKIQVLPKQDGTCPNCYSKIESGKKGKTSLSTKSEKLKRKSSDSRKLISPPSKNRSTKIVSAPNEIQETSGKKVRESNSQSHAPKPTTQTVSLQSAKRRKKGNMYCPSCGKQIPDNSTFCLYCGTKISSPSVSVAKAPVQWEYSEFVWTPPPNSQAIAGADRLTEGRELWWSEARPFVLEELQKWQAEGWEPVGAVGSDCIQVEEMQVLSSRYWNGAAWLMWLFALIPTFGLAFFALFLKRTVYKPVNIRVQMRAPKGARMPISSTIPIQSDISPISTNRDKPLAFTQSIEELAKAGQFEKAAQLLEEIYNKDPSTAPTVVGFPKFTIQPEEPASGYALLVHLAERAGKRDLAVRFLRRMVKLTPPKEIWRARHAARDAGIDIKKEAKDILEQRGISWKWYE